MRLTIDNEPRDLIPINTYRETYKLPDDFGVARFEPKDFTGLAAIDKSGSEMNQLRQAILQAIPESVTMPDALILGDTLQAVFRNGLYGINEKIGLKVVEVEYAVAGLGDVLQNWMYALIRAQSSKSDAPKFQQVYGEWLDGSTRLSQQPHDYEHDGATWQVKIINNAYGRVGLRVVRDAAVDYVYDGVYACPAEGYMATLLADMAEQIAEKLLKSS